MRSPFWPFTRVLEKIRREVTRETREDRKCLYEACWGIADHAQMLREQGLSVPTPNRNPTITIQAEPKLQPARSAIFSDRCADCRPAFPHPPVGGQWRTFGSALRNSFNNSRSPRQKAVRYRLVRDGFTHRASDFASRAEMNAAPDAGKPHFDGGVGEALIRRRHAG
jgi:hypothetical protein